MLQCGTLPTSVPELLPLAPRGLLGRARAPGEVSSGLATHRDAEGFLHVFHEC